MNRLLAQGEKRLSFFDDVGSELRRAAAADILRRVDRPGRDEYDVASLERHRRFAFDLVLQRAFEDIGLFDVDVLINRTLVYGALTGIVASAFVILVGFLSILFQSSGNSMPCMMRWVLLRTLTIF